MRELAGQDLPYERQMWPREEAHRVLREARRAAQGPADRGEDRRPVRGLLLHDQGSRHLRRLLRRPARAVHRQAEGVQAAVDVERVLEGRRAQPADAAHLRHRVLQGRRPEAAPALRSRRRRSATTAGSARTSACSCSTRGRRARRSGSARARRSTTCSPTTCARCCSRPATPRSRRRSSSTRRLWETSGHWQHYRAEHVPRRVRERRDGREGDELPGPHARVRERGAQLSRPAAAACTSRRRCIATRRRACSSGLTRVRQFSQDDAHCFVTESQIGEEVERLLNLVKRVYGDFGLAVRGQAVDPARRSSSARRPTWDHAEAELKTRARRGRRAPTSSTRATARSTGRRSTSTSPTPSAAKWQCATIQLDYQLPAAVRPEVHRRRQRRAPAGGHPPGDFRQLRAVHRPADRALRRGVSAVAGARPGGRAADCRPAPATTPRRCGRDWPRPASGSSSTAARRRLVIRSGRPSCRRCPTCWSSGDREAAEGTVAVRSRTGGDLGARPVDAFVADGAGRGRAQGSRQPAASSVPG